MARTIVIVLFASVVLVAAACEQMETFETTYPDAASAIKAGAVGEGKWVPKFLPSSATNIRETHNMDTNELWLSFHFQPTDYASFGQACTPITASKTAYPRKSPGRWWPIGLLQGSGDVPGSYEFYQCAGSGILAIDASKSAAFYWDLDASSP
jgi:hypothetical protein